MKGVILGNGFPPSKELVMQYLSGAKVICCDGAANWAFKMGVPVDVVVGDMDSICIDTGAVRKVCLPREKDDTDMQAGVNLAVGMGCTDITILGALGNRMDHSLANIHLLVQLHKKNIAARIINENNTVFVANSPFEIPAPDNKNVVLSILPLESGIVINETDGLYYPVLNREFPLGQPYFISNVWNKATASVNLQGGYAAVMLCKD
ncbi:MAG: thiamine diphosphokinase [Christensenellales bacterium]